MPRKKRNKSSNGNGSSNGESQPSATQKSSGNSDGGFPPHLLRNNSHHQYENDADALETLVPNAVFVAGHALSSKECQEWITYAEEGNRWDVVSHPATKWIAHRECGRIQKNDWNMSHRLYERIQAVVQKVSPQLDIFDKASLLSNEVKCNAINKSNSLPKYQPVSCNPNLRLYKYTKGQWFGRHVDGSNKIDFSGNTPISSADVKEGQTEITVLFYLSSCRGGATRFHLPQGRSSGKRKKGQSSGIAFTPEEGSVLLHVHGDHCLEHEAEPVLEGVKYVLRTDIVYGIV
mmetsp:Transcript_22030/g.39641  ORF Transcript_22030/g.39641 Transcript_22030/m.39641 type:complete len:290 (-) Transcript_22030:334-1203(-)